MALEADDFSELLGGFGIHSKTVSMETIKKEQNRPQERIPPSWQKATETQKEVEPPLQVNSTVSVSLENRDSQDVAFSEEYEYFNHSPTPIYMVGRDNVGIRLDSTSRQSRVRNMIIVQRTLRFISYEGLLASIKDYEKYIKRNRGQKDRVGSVIYKAMTDFYSACSRSQFNGTNITIKVEYTYDINKIYDSGIYVRDLDKIFSKSENVVYPNDAITNSTIRVNEILGEKSFSGVVIEIVDNETSFDKKFFYSAGEVFQVNPKKDPGRQDGVYLLSISNDKNSKERLEALQVLSMEDAINSGILFDSAESARTGGNPDRDSDLKLKSLTSELTRDKIEFERTKSEYMREKEVYDRNKEARERELAELQHTHALEMMAMKKRLQEMEDTAKRKNIERSDYYEERSYSRKDRSEIIKTGPAMIIAAATAVGAFMALKK